MAAKVISQRKFAKLVASTGPLAQPPGAITRASNLLFTTRGSLQIADGSQYIGAISTLQLEEMEIFANLVSAQYPYLVGLALNPTSQGNVSGVGVSAGSGSSNPAGIYAFGVVGITANGGHSDMASTAAQVTFNSGTTFGNLTFTWTGFTDAVTYQIWMWKWPALSSSTDYQGVLIASGITGLTYTTSGTLPTLPVVTTPVGDSTHLLEIVLSQIGISGGQTIVEFNSPSTNFPSFLPASSAQVPGSPSFAGALLPTIQTPYGGVPGACSNIPQVVQFAGQAILILGNGYAPQALNPALGSSAPVAPLINTFTAAYPTWQSGVDWTTGSQLTAANGSVNYLFTVTQGGVSGTTAPTWNFTTNSETSDNSVIWTCNGPIPASVAPIGAAHAVAYAGSLWLANTWPTTTQYAAWIASTLFAAGQQIAVLDGSGNSWLFVVETGGTSGGSAPSWTFTAGDTTTDNSVTWYCVGELSAALAAGIDGPCCLKMSDSNNPNSWNPVNTAFIGKDDGTQITGMQPFTIAALGISPTGSLCIFKEFTTYQVIGIFGSSSFEIQPAQTNLGCLVARSIQFIPGFGVVRFSHLGFAVFDGINDRLISEDIRPYLFGGVDSESDLTPVDPQSLWNSHSAQTTSPPMYMCAMPLTGGGGALTRLFCYDLVMKAWAILDLPAAITSLNWMQAAEGYPLVLAGTIDSGFGYVMRMQSGDKNWNQDVFGGGGSSVDWSFRSPDVFGEGSSQRLFVEQVTIRGYGNASMVASIIANLWVDGQQLGSQAIDVVPMGGSNLFEARVSIFRNGERFHLDVSGNNGGAAGTIDALDWAVTPKSALARRVIG